MERFAVLDSGRLVRLDARVDGERVALAPASLEAEPGWKLAPEGLCRGSVGVPVRDRAALGSGADERRRAQQGLEAPDFRLPDLGGRLHALSEQRGRKVRLVAYASGCGRREDLPAWQALHEELGPEGLMPITLALDPFGSDAPGTL